MELYLNSSKEIDYSQNWEKAKLNVIFATHKSYWLKCDPLEPNMES